MHSSNHHTDREMSITEPPLENADTNFVNQQQVFPMIPIREIAQHALITGRLTVEAEKLIGQLLLSACYTLEDLNAYMSLQLAAMAGSVKQESLELVQPLPTSF